MATMTLSRKRASGASLPTSSLSKKLKLTSICPSQPPNQSILPINSTALLKQNPPDLMPDLQIQVTCLTLFLLLVAKMSQTTPRTNKVTLRRRYEYREGVKALNKMDILGVAARKMKTAVDDINKITRDIERILESELPLFPDMQLNKACQDFMVAYEDILSVLQVGLPES
ncbi:hypothetical protein LB505_014311 [Fusarium chuoi]|nr:hypothetical protein LB505_014311 [Fusarium chuoi]